MQLKYYFQILVGISSSSKDFLRVLSQSNYFSLQNYIFSRTSAENDFFADHILGLKHNPLSANSAKWSDKLIQFVC